MDNLIGLIFDVDGVIADTEGVNVAASVMALEELFQLQDLKEEDFAAGVGRGAEVYVQSAARAHGLELTEEQVAAAVQTRQDNFLKMVAENPVPPLPGVLELMAAAMENNTFRVGIATSGTRVKSLATLQSAKIPYEKMVYVNGSEVKNKKPDPELFLTAVKRLGIPAAQCVVFEDSPSGVQAAKTAGCKCIAITNTTPAEQLQQADMIVNSLTEISLETIIKLINTD
jgi:HAD superfamily hydrolase (TIGR01509 family)